MKLIKLSDGNWIHPAAVIAVRKGERTLLGCGDVISAPHVIVDYLIGSTGNTLVVDCASEQERDEAIARFAEQCNVKQPLSVAAESEDNT